MLKLIILSITKLYIFKWIIIDQVQEISEQTLYALAHAMAVPDNQSSVSQNGLAPHKTRVTLSIYYIFTVTCINLNACPWMAGKGCYMRMWEGVGLRPFPKTLDSDMQTNQSDTSLVHAFSLESSSLTDT
jgi:hypothetical protein